MCDSCVGQAERGEHPRTHTFGAIAVPRPAAAQQPRAVVHQHIVCDACGALPIIGTRFKCLVCDDVDLCARCEAAQRLPSPDNNNNNNNNKQEQHSLEHALAKIVKPLTRPLAVRADAKERADVKEHTNVDEGADVKVTAEEVNAEEVTAEEVTAEEVTAEESAGQRKAREWDLGFVEDVTVPDETVVPAGGEFQKIWAVANTGTRAWPAGLSLQFVGGFGNNGPSGTARASVATCSEVAPGDTCELACDVKAPETPGRFMSFWRLADGTGRVFGDRLWIDIVVEPATAVQASLSSSSVITPAYFTDASSPTSSLDVVSLDGGPLNTASTASTHESTSTHESSTTFSPESSEYEFV